MWSILLELRFKELVLMVGYRLLVQNEDVRDIIVMDLQRCSLVLYRLRGIPCPNLFLKVFEHLCPVAFDQVKFS